MSPLHMEMVDQLRDLLGDPLVVTSGYRCLRHHLDIYQKLRKKPPMNSAHLLGLATDLKCADSKLRWKLIFLAREVGFRRIEWGTRTWVHLDTGPEELGFSQDVLFLP